MGDEMDRLAFALCEEMGQNPHEQYSRCVGDFCTPLAPRWAYFRGRASELLAERRAFARLRERGESDDAPE